MAAKEIKLSVDGTSIEIDPFVRGFIDHTVSGIIAALKGIGEIKTLDISLEGEMTTINLNNSPISVKPFVGEIVKNTIFGMVSTLKEVGEIKKVKINIRK